MGGNVHTMDKWWSCEIRCAQLLGTPQNQSEVEIAWEAMFDANYHNKIRDKTHTPKVNYIWCKR